MLCLTRRTGQSIICTLEDGRTIEFVIDGVQGNQVKVCVEAPKTIRIDRHEIWLRRQGEVDGNVS